MMETPEKIDKNNNNQEYSDEIKYILIKIDYSYKAILPIKKGLIFLELWGAAHELREPYEKPKRIKNHLPELTVSFMSEKEYKIIQMESLLSPEED